MGHFTAANIAVFALSESYMGSQIFNSVFIRMASLLLVVVSWAFMIRNGGLFGTNCKSYHHTLAKILNLNCNNGRTFHDSSRQPPAPSRGRAPERRPKPIPYRFGGRHLHRSAHGGRYGGALLSFRHAHFAPRRASAASARLRGNVFHSRRGD